MSSRGTKLVGECGSTSRKSPEVPPKAISPEGVDALNFAVSPDGQYVVGIGPDQKDYLFPISGGDAKVIVGVQPGDIPINFSGDGHSIYV